jgi:hypothetical protein
MCLPTYELVAALVGDQCPRHYSQAPPLLLGEEGSWTLFMLLLLLLCSVSSVSFSLHV